MSKTVNMAAEEATCAKVEQKEKTVKIIVPKERKDEPDMFVAFNGRTWLIKRGVEVEVPECCAEVIKQHFAAVAEADAYQEEVGK